MIENQNSYPMNLLVTLDRNYVPQLNVMLFSALQSDPAAFFDVLSCMTRGCQPPI